MHVWPNCGDATISVAGVDLVYVWLKLLVVSVDTLEGLRKDLAAGSRETARPGS